LEKKKMKERNVKTKWKPLKVVSPTEEDYGRYAVYSADAFNELIRYERVRADRDSRYFSMLSFSCGEVSQRVLSLFIDQLKENMRIIDHLGWIDEQSIGVILPSTDPAGAKGFAEKVEALIAKVAYRIPYDIYSYPQGEVLEEGKKTKFLEEGDKGVFNHHHVEKAIIPHVPLWKRAFDVFLSGIGLLLLSPFFLLMGCYIKIVSPGSVLYRSKRIGLGGKEFTFLKFRSMHENNNQGTHASHAIDFIKGDKAMDKLDHKDPRIIPGGHFLRASCIDELPQLINVFRGDMSLVGPRPCIPYERDEYLRWHKHRFDTLPGMTGLWQVSGKNKLTFQQMVRLDIRYARNMSLSFDIKLILKTFPVVWEMLMEKRRAPSKQEALSP